MLSTPDPKYPGEGAQSLVDRRKGFTDVLKEPSWLGYRHQPFEAGIGFEGQRHRIEGIVISYAKNIGAYSLPPAEVEVWAGENKDQLKLIKSIRRRPAHGLSGIKS